MLLAHTGPRRAPPRLVSDERGTVAIEFALVAGLFLMLLFGIVAFGFQYATRIALSYAVAEGGRAAVAGLSDTERQSLATTAISYALNAYSPLVDPNKATVSVTSVGTSSNGEMVKVSISYSDTRFNVLPFVPNLSSLPPVSTTFIVADPSG
ncbi:pilus assembly protein [Aerococcus urinae]|nr:pilus assembly protein [Aerococcus urinae]